MTTDGPQTLRTSICYSVLEHKTYGFDAAAEASQLFVSEIQLVKDQRLGSSFVRVHFIGFGCKSTIK